MKVISLMVTVMLFSSSLTAKTYTIGSGKWTDPRVWGNEYIGSVIKAGDVVIIKGHITLTIPLLVEGILQLERGASIMGMKDLTVAQTGRFVNNGNTVVRSIINEGSICNNCVMEAMSNIQNTSTIENNHNMLAGNNFSSAGGNAYGKGGRIYANNSATVSVSTELGLGVNVYSMKKDE